MAAGTFQFFDATARYLMAEATFAGAQTVKTYGKMVRVVAEFAVVEI